MVTIKKMGSLYLNGQAAETGVVCNGEKITIGNTVPGKEISWVSVNGLLVADRCVCVYISWEQLDRLGLVFGAPVTIDRQQYICRLLKIGDREGVSNEWDAILDVTTESDETWHWSPEFFWGQETWERDTECRAVRGGGGISARAWYNDYASAQGEQLGFRPVLEPLFLGPLSSDLMGAEMKVYLQQDFVAGILADVSSFDLILQLPTRNDRVSIPGTAWVGDNLLAIDRQVVKYLSITREEK